MSGEIKMSGFGIDPRNPRKIISKELTYKLNDDNSASGYGRPITIDAACVMIDNYNIQLGNKLKDAEDKSETEKNDIQKEVLNSGIAVIFGKETLLRLLSQPNCEAIRFYSCVNDEGRASLVLSGITENGKDIVAQKNGADNLLDIIAERNEKMARQEPFKFNDEIELDEKGGPNGKFSLADYIDRNDVVTEGFTDSLLNLFKVNSGIIL